LRMPGVSTPGTGEATSSRGLDVALSPRVEAELFKVVQEALTNIRKHAHATQVDVILQRAPDRTTLTVQDNGVGFMPSTDNDGRHGLLGMRERVKLLGGRLHVRSRPGRGTKITVTIPAGDAGQP
jgi:signal transduction histidine kinase